MYQKDYKPEFGTSGGKTLSGETDVKNIKKQLNDYQAELQAIREELEIAPKGRMVQRKNTYTQVVDGIKTTITNDLKLISRHTRKKYLLKREKQLLNNIICYSDFDDSSANMVINTLAPTYKKRPISDFYHPEVVKWQVEKYEQNPYYIENRKYRTKMGITVRSKSELIIANMLEDYHLPYRYEPLLKMDFHKKYPDFVIKNPFTNKTVIWEHFGALNREGYEQRMNEKMDWFLKNGYNEGENLIYTFEFHLNNPTRIKNLIENVIL